VSKYFFVNAAYQNYRFNDNDTIAGFFFNLRNFKNENAQLGGTFLFQSNSSFIPFINTEFMYGKSTYAGYDSFFEDYIEEKISLKRKKIGVGAFYFFNPNVAVKMNVSFVNTKENKFTKPISSQNSINITMDLRSFLQNHSLSFEKDSKESRFVNEDCFSITGVINYSYIKDALNNHSFYSNIEYQKMIQSNIHFGAKTEINNGYIELTPMMGYYIRVLPNFYVNPRVGAQFSGAWNSFKINRKKIHPFGGLNLEYFLNKNLSYRIATSATFEDGLENLNLSSGFNFYLK
jgi:hypothetical protein